MTCALFSAKKQTKASNFTSNAAVERSKIYVHPPEYYYSGHMYDNKTNNMHLIPSTSIMFTYPAQRCLCSVTNVKHQNTNTSTHQTTCPYGLYLTQCSHHGEDKKKILHATAQAREIIFDRLSLQSSIGGPGRSRVHTTPIIIYTASVPSTISRTHWCSMTVVAIISKLLLLQQH